MTDDVARQAAALLIEEDVADLVSEQPAPVAAEPEPEVPSWQADTSGLDFLEEEDDEPEVTAPPTFDEEDEVEPDEYEDPAATKLRKDLAKANKQLAWEREQRITSSRKNWKAEAERRFPLADVDSIQADSRRATLKAAAAQQVKLEKKLGPLLAKVDTLRGEVITEARQEARAEAAQAWGSPQLGSPGGADTEPAENSQRYKPSAHKTLLALTAEKLRGGQYDSFWKD